MTVARSDSGSLMDGVFRLDPETVRCPYEAYAESRSEPPALDERLNAYVVTRYADVDAVLRDPETYSSAMATGQASVTPLARKIIEDPSASDTLRQQALRRVEISRSAVLLLADPPEHVRQRRLVSGAFTPRRIREMEDDVYAITKELVDGFADGRIELVKQLGVALPITVMANILGVPKSMMDSFKWWSDSFTAGVGNLDLARAEVEDMFSAVDQFYDYFTEQIDDRRSNPRDDLLTDLVNARLQGEKPLTLDEMLQMVGQFLVAGNETTTNLIASAMHKLVIDPVLMAEVRADPAQVAALVEEVLRLEAPAQGLFRTATRDAEIGGTFVPAGSHIWLVFASANRDPDGFPVGDTLTLQDALTRRHLSFGKGEHFCLGSPLARMEARISIEVMLARFAHIELDIADADIEYHPNFVIHGIKALPLILRKQD